MRVLIDCTDTYYSGLNTGIQRVVRNFVAQALEIGPAMGITCIPVILRDGIFVPITGFDDPRYQTKSNSLRIWLNNRYLQVTRSLARTMPSPRLRTFLLAHRREFGLAWLLYMPVRLFQHMRPSRRSPLPHQSVALAAKAMRADCLFLPDASWVGHSWSTLERLKASGMRVAFLVHDIIPLTHPDCCHPHHVAVFQQWFPKVIQTADFLVYNSAATQDSVWEWLERRDESGSCPPGVVIHLGHDLAPIIAGKIRHTRLRAALACAASTYLCVGTLEPRKNHTVLLEAFEMLWAEEDESRALILIGRAGWLCEALLDRIKGHPERGRRLFWFDDVDDHDLALTYTRVKALIFPSRIEGFGLPLVEALAKGLPVIASDIEVFREIAGGHARFFPPGDPQALADSVRQLEREAFAGNPDFHWPDWRESTFRLLVQLRDRLCRPATASESPAPESVPVPRG